MYQNPGIQPSDTFYPSYDGFSTLNNLNNHPVPYITAPNANSNDEQCYYPTTSFATESTSYTPQFIGHNSNDQILEQNPSNTIPTNSSNMANASLSQIQTVEILGYEIIIIPTSSPLASFISLDVHNQLQQDNIYQLSQSNASSPQIQTIEIPGYKIIIAPTSSLSSNLDMQHQFQQENTYLDYSFNSVNPPQLIQDQNHFSSAGEISIRPNVINFVQDNTQPQHQQQNNLGLNESLNDFNNFFG
ncbi:10610_t:CDS:1 [Funneliformis geosporum]|uniref:10610_t:CDS:1 n=1 Tax=Funneliformis geosporum TaxID=1117311 RepID=A0A9W4WU66_9GLOM|nr:10610_t:CDS:1 [Funneliformis geosporum]